MTNHRIITGIAERGSIRASFSEWERHGISQTFRVLLLSDFDAKSFEKLMKRWEKAAPRDEFPKAFEQLDQILEEGQ